MGIFGTLYDTVRPFFGSAMALAGLIVALWLVQRLLERRRAATSGHRFAHQALMLFLTAAGLLVVLLVMPISESLRGQLLTFFGILLSAAIALSSTTFLGNAMAGIMLKAVRNFRAGDFIRCGEHFGRVSERGLLHVEIQTEDRDLITLPNMYLVTNPVTTVRTSGTIVSATVSLGYDTPRKRIEELLLEGASEAGLQEPFVQVLELGDFSVTYRVAGLLTEVKTLLSARSRLRAKAMDALHGGGIEIVSPNFMNQRVLPTERPVIPAQPDLSAPEPTAPQAGPERLAFDKAEMAESIESLRRSHAELVEQIKALGDDAGEQRDRLERRRERLEARIAAREQEAGNGDR